MAGIRRVSALWRSFRRCAGLRPVGVLFCIEHRCWFASTWVWFESNDRHLNRYEPEAAAARSWSVVGG